METAYLIQLYSPFGVSMAAALSVVRRTASSLAPLSFPVISLERFPGWDLCTQSLSSSDCEPLELQELLQLCSKEERRSWDSQMLGYGQQAGEPYLRDAISHVDYQGGLSPEDVTVVAPQEGIFLTMHALALQPSDSVIVMKPAYQSLHSVPQAMGCKVHSWMPRTVVSGNRKNFQFALEDLQNIVESLLN